MFLNEGSGKTLRERDILLFESPKLYDCSRRTTLIRYGFFRVLFPVIVLDILLYDHKVVRCLGRSSLITFGRDREARRSRDIADRGAPHPAEREGNAAPAAI